MAAGGPYHYIKRKVEDAFEAMISAESERTIYKGASALIMADRDRIAIVSERATPHLIGGESDDVGGFITGNWHVAVAFRVCTEIDDSFTREDGHALACGAVGDSIFSNDVVDNINQVGSQVGITAFAWRPGDSTDYVDGDEYVTEYNGVLYCAPSDGVS